VSRNPSISVIVPTCHRNDRLAICLERLKPGQQTLSSSEYEVIVSDDGSVSNAEELVRTCFSFARWSAGPKCGPAANRNHGARLVTGDWLVFVDDDCVPDANFLLEIQKMAALGRCEIIEGKTLCTGRTEHPLEEQIENLNGGVFWSCNLAVSLEFFQSIGGFDEDFVAPAAEDMEFGDRALKHGARVMFASNAVVSHPARRLTFCQWCRRALLVRWFVLYQLKTAKAPGNLLIALFTRCVDVVRTSRKHLRECKPHNWRRQLFLAGWSIISFPVLLPWIAYWEVRFRRELQQNRSFIPVSISGRAACK
jgi:GT2 family glycosyltransferase